MCSVILRIAYNLFWNYIKITIEKEKTNTLKKKLF